MFDLARSQAEVFTCLYRRPRCKDSGNWHTTISKKFAECEIRSPNVCTQLLADCLDHIECIRHRARLDALAQCLELFKDFGMLQTVNLGLRVVVKAHEKLFSHEMHVRVVDHLLQNINDLGLVATLSQSITQRIHHGELASVFGLHGFGADMKSVFPASLTHFASTFQQP